MAIAQASVPYFEMGRVVKRTFSVIGHNIGTFAVLSLIQGIPLAIIYSLAGSLPRGADAIRQFSFGLVASFGLTGLVFIFSMFVLQAAIVHGTVADLNGRRASILNCLSTGISHFIPLFLIALVVGLGVMVGFILLVLPGIMWAIAWSVAVPARVVERTGVMDSISRSRDLTKGHRWAVFGLWIVFFVLQLAIGMVIGAVVGAGIVTTGAVGGTGGSTAAVVAQTIAAMVNGVIGSAGVASIYYELRLIKEGIGPEALAAVFD